MTLAVSALDVAFVAALVGIAAPLSAWLIAKETREHELENEREDRLFHARREIYEAVLTDVSRSVATTFAWDTTLRGVAPVEPHLSSRHLSADDWLDLQARASAIASEEVLSALDRLVDVQAKFWALVVRVSEDPACTQPRRAENITAEETGELTELARRSNELRHVVAREIRTDLAGRRRSLGATDRIFGGRLFGTR
jgi:hypothetical protein